MTWRFDMLVLGRKRFEAVVIGDNALVIVGEISRDSVILLVHAPNLPIRKGEDAEATLPLKRFLVIPRRKDEKIVIAGVVTVTLLHHNGRAVSLGIEAPDDVRLFRAELDDWSKAA